MQLSDVLQDSVDNKEVNQVGRASAVGVCTDNPQQVDVPLFSSAMSLLHQHVVEGPLGEGVPREVGRVVGDDRRPYHVRVVDVLEQSGDVRMTCDDVHLEAVVQRQTSLQGEVRQRATEFTPNHNSSNDEKRTQSMVWYSTV